MPSEREKVVRWLLGEFWDDPDEGSEVEAERLANELLALLATPEREALEELRRILWQSRLFKGYVGGPLHDPWADRCMKNADALLASKEADDAK